MDRCTPASLPNQFSVVQVVNREIWITIFSLLQRIVVFLFFLSPRILTPIWIKGHKTIGPIQAKDAFPHRCQPYTKATKANVMAP